VCDVHFRMVFGGLAKKMWQPGSPMKSVLKLDEMTSQPWKGCERVQCILPYL